MDAELLQYKEQMKRQKGPALNATKQRALRLLRQKKVYEQQRDNTYNQQFNVEQAAFTTQNLKDSAETVSAMQAANKELKSQYKQMNITQIEDMHYDMSELMEDANEIQDILGRSYAVDDDLVDEDALESELAALEDEMAYEDTLATDTGAASYLDDLMAPPTGIHAPAAASTDNPSAVADAPAPGAPVDAYGLPE